MPRGGARQGRPGVAYGHRTDLNKNRLPVQSAPGQPYGARVAQERAQQAVPMAAPPAPPPMPLDAPTARPGEPVTAGAALGPGPGVEAIPAMPAFGAEPVDVLRALYARFPSEDLRELLEDHDEGVGF